MMRVILQMTHTKGREVLMGLIENVFKVPYVPLVVGVVVNPNHH
jgi:hypothetical protein